MDQHPQRLLARLDAIGAALAGMPAALALIGVGSSGQQLDRLDRYSDLDFFVVVRPEAKPDLLARLDWLAEVAPIAYQFRNTADGYKLLFVDGIFCEFAIFTPAELAQAHYTAGRVVWSDPAFVAPPTDSSPPPAAQRDWLIGEILTNLYVGLGRERRGERLSAAHFIQGYAVDRLLELAALIEPPQPGHADPFGAERRFEQRFPQTARQLARFVPGYEHSVEAARAILSFVEQHAEVNPALKQAILTLCVVPPAPEA